MTTSETAQLVGLAQQASITARRMVRIGSAGRAENDARRAAHYGRQALRHSLDDVSPCIRCMDGNFDFGGVVIGLNAKA